MAKTNKDLAVALCEKFPDTPSKTLGRKLYAANKLRFSSEGAAYSAVRRVRGNQGQRNRKWASESVKRELGKAGWVPKCPESLAIPWEPFELGNGIKVVSLSDFHVPYHDKAAIEAAVKHTKKKFRPDVVLINGDLIDLATISRFEKNPEHRDVQTEISITVSMLQWLRHEFLKARIVYRTGNHDSRMDKFVFNRCSEFWGLENLRLQKLLTLDDFGIEYVYERPVKVGDLTVLHGHELPGGGGVTPARAAFLKTNTNVLVAHHHRTSSHTETSLDKREVTAFSQGCLCECTPSFARVNKWNLGFAEVDVASNGEYEVFNRQISFGRKIIR